MLHVDNVEYFHEVLKKIEEYQDEIDEQSENPELTAERRSFLRQIDLLRLFEEQLRYLHNYRDKELVRVRLGYDYAPLSFSILWEMRRLVAEHTFYVKDGSSTKDIVYSEWKPWINGGLIFHNGAGMGDGTFTAEIGAPSGPHWSVHT